MILFNFKHLSVIPGIGSLNLGRTYHIPLQPPAKNGTVFIGMVL